LLDGKAPKQISRLKIIDPSCGSGSFLIRVFERMCLAHLEWFIAHPKDCNKEDVFRDADGTLHLTTHYKRRVMLDSIFGVDLDGQAVEVTMLSLYLKILEGENRTTLGAQRVLFPKETFLPDLRDNIKCGNSLIARDFTSETDSPEDISEVNAFDWKEEFGASGSAFDAVVGNPPWGAEFTERQRKYLAKSYERVVERMPDSYIYFIDKASILLKKDGSLGFVIPSTILNQVDAQPVRELLLDRGITTLTSLGTGVFGPKVLNTTTVIASRPQPRNGIIKLNDLTSVPLGERKNKLNDGWTVPWTTWQQEVNADPHSSFLIANRATSNLLDSLRLNFGRLSEVVDGSIQRGVSPDIVSAHVLTPAEAREHQIERDLLRRSISGSQIKRYQSFVVDQRIIYTTDDTRINAYPNAKKYILAERKKYRQRFPDREECVEVRTDKHPWWRLHRPRSSEIFASPKIIGLTTAKTIELAFDERDSLVVTDAMYVFKIIPDVSQWAVMAIMQSEVFLFLYRTSNQGENRVIPQVKAAKLYELPFPRTDAISDSPLDALARQLTALNDSVRGDISEKAAKARLRECASLERKIEEEVRMLYRITDGDAKIIEAGTESRLSD
jgi:adenine-specific DNA-methyltransferase